MGAIKEFFHDEICAMADGEDIVIDVDYMEQKWQEEGEALLLAMEADLEEINHSGVPKFLSSKF